MTYPKLLLVDPCITYGGWNSFGKSPELSMINHGITMLATIAHNSGYEAKVLDCRKLKGFYEFEEKIIDFSPDIIGIGFKSLDFFPAKKMAITIKKVLPDSIIIIGGLHVSIAPDDVLNDLEFSKNIDFIIKGEAEITLLGLLSKIKNNEPSERILQGIRPNLDDLPIINREFYDIEAELNNPIWLGKKPCVTMLFTRGCNYNCAFCQPSERKLFGSIKRYRSVDNVIDELKILKEKYNFKYIHFHDDNFIQNIKWVKEFIEKYANSEINANFAIQTRADIVIAFEKYVEKLTKIGLDTISIGFESGSNRILKFLRKGTTVIQNVRAAMICRKYNLNIVANYMFGVPTETKKEMFATKRLIESINPSVKSPAFYTPLPGSYLFDYCVETGLFEDKKDFSLYFRNVRDSGLLKGVDYKFMLKIVNDLNYKGIERYLYYSKIWDFFKKLLNHLLFKLKYKKIIYRFFKKVKEITN